MQIKSIVVYSHDGRKRTIDLVLGEVNIITGRSETGKSALMPIIEYCLGASNIGVPVNVIRNSVSWYGLHLVFSDIECFVARRDPGPKKNQSADIYIDIGSQVTVPEADALVQNANKDSLDAFLSERLGIAKIDAEPAPGSTRAEYQIDFGHTRFFNYQDQNEIANKTILFHRQAEEGMAMTIRDVLPYFLGAEDEDRLLQKQRLRSLRQTLKGMEREYDERSRARQVVSGRAAALITEAANMGLRLSPSANEEPLEDLRRIARLKDPEADHTRIGDELTRLEDQRDRLLQEQRALKERLRTYHALLQSGSSYSAEMNAQRSRLSSIGLLNGEFVKPVCPLCDTHLERRMPSVEMLRSSIERLDKQLETVRVSQPRLEEAIGGANERLGEIRSELHGVDVAIILLESKHEELTKRREIIASTAYLRGRISAYLETVDETETTDDFDERLRALRVVVTELDRNLNAAKIRERLDSIASITSLDMTQWAKDLNLEYKEMPLRLDFQKLTVATATKHGPVYMNQIGSAANWLGFHLIAFAALHKWFLENDRPVPRFLFLDQPTQAFYNAQRAAGESDDRRRVRELYGFILGLPEKLKKSVQIMVIDHEDREDAAFQNVVRENWHARGEALIPSDWPQAE